MNVRPLCPTPPPTPDPSHPPTPANLQHVRQGEVVHELESEFPEVELHRHQLFVVVGIEAIQLLDRGVGLGQRGAVRGEVGQSNVGQVDTAAENEGQRSKVVAGEGQREQAELGGEGGEVGMYESMQESVCK